MTSVQTMKFYFFNSTILLTIVKTRKTLKLVNGDRHKLVPFQFSFTLVVVTNDFDIKTATFCVSQTLRCNFTFINISSNKTVVFFAHVMNAMRRLTLLLFF